MQPLVEAPGTPRLLVHGDRAFPYLRRPPASIAVALEAERDDAVVVRPDRSSLIGEGIVGGVPRGQRPDTPSAPQVGLEEALHDPPGVIRARDAAPEAVAGVRCDRPDGLLLGIE